jgi:trehalose 2-sulfotransferase
MLSDALNNTGLVGQPEEYFRPDFTQIWSERWGLRADASYDEYIQAAIRFGTTANGMFGVKLHWYQFVWFLAQLRRLDDEDSGAPDTELLAKWLPNPRYVLIRRRDKARQAVSYYRAAISNVWFLPVGESPPSTLVETVPDLGAIRWLEHLLRTDEIKWERWFEAAGVEPLTIWYEEFCADYVGTIGHLLDWLGVERDTGFEIDSPGIVKQADDYSELLLEDYLACRDSLPVSPPAIPLRQRSTVGGAAQARTEARVTGRQRLAIVPRRS